MIRRQRWMNANLIMTRSSWRFSRTGREDAPAFFQPADQAFDHVAAPVCGWIKLDRSGGSMVAVPGGNHRMNAELQQIVVKPIGAIRHVARQFQLPSEWLSVVVELAFVGAEQQRFQGSGFMHLAGGEMEVQRMAMRIAQQVNFTRTSPARPT
jgi:hypothetical protein